MTLRLVDVDSNFSNDKFDGKNFNCFTLFDKAVGLLPLLTNQSTSHALYYYILLLLSFPKPCSYKYELPHFPSNNISSIPRFTCLPIYNFLKLHFFQFYYFMYLK